MKKLLPLSLFALLLSTTLAGYAQETPAPTNEAGNADAPALPASPDSANATVQATEAYNAGLAALSKGDMTTAAVEFQKATELNPNDAGALMFLGYVKLRQEAYPEALKSLEAAKALSSKLDPKLLPILHNNLGIAYANSQRPTDALAAYQEAIKLSKEEYTDARYNLAFALLSQKKHKEAIPHLLNLRDQRADDKAFQSSIYDGLAEAYENTNDWGAALGAYKKVTELNPRDAAARFNFALALSKTGRLDDAITQGNEVLKVRPNHEQTLLLLGDLYSRKGRWADVKTNLNRYVLADDKNFTAWFTLGVAYDYTSDFANALDAYAKAEALSPNDPAVKNNIGRILYKQAEKDEKKYAEAERYLQEALKLDGSFDDARVNLALVYTAQEKWEDSISQWKVYLDNIRTTMMRTGVSAQEKTELKKRAQSARGALAENYLKAGTDNASHYASAVREYRLLLADAPDNLDAMSNLGLALYHTKDYTNAISTYREVIKRDPKNAIAHNNLGVVLEASGKREEAVQNYRKALQLNPNYAEAKVNVERLTTAT